jgi:hypothetical protein
MRKEAFRGTNSPVDRIMQIQETIGNQAVQELLKSGFIRAKLKISIPNDVYEQEADKVAEQVMHMADPNTRQQTEKGTVVRTTPFSRHFTPIVQSLSAEMGNTGVGPCLESRINSLKGSGQSMSESVQAFFEQRFGYDFSHVRMHTDTQAAELAREVNANAFTVEQDIVFGTGQYAPSTSAGRKLLAHELVHVMQQTIMPSSGAYASDVATEMELQQAGQQVFAGNERRIATKISAGHIQRQGDRNPLDEKAKAIIAKARDEKIEASVRAVQVIKSIINEYYPAENSKVHSVEYNNGRAGTGLLTHQKLPPSSRSEESTGLIYVGDTFLNGVTERHFARRVLQVGHELEHINQWRKGLAGGHKKNEREFLAYYHEALEAEKTGTGRMQHATRVALIDGALRNYYCLSADKQEEYAAQRKELLDRRAVEVKASGRQETTAPTRCER